MTITDIQAETRALCDANSISYPDAVLLLRENAAYEEIIAKIIGADGTWNFDDTNYTTHPVATTNLVADQQDYAFDVTHLELERLEVLDKNGKYQLLTPIDKRSIDIALSEYKNVAGLPTEYDKNGRSVFLYPKPAAASVTITAGLKAYFKRTAQIFTSADVSTGTKVPGFASPYHMLIPYKAALPYCALYQKDRVPFLFAEIQRLEDLMIKHYSRRERDVRKVMTMKTNNYR